MFMETMLLNLRFGRCYLSRLPLLVALVPLFSSTMGAARPAHVTIAQGASLSSELLGGSPPVPDEASPLLHPEGSQEPPRNASGRWLAAQLPASAFLDNNAGLLLVAASQFFFAAMGISVKWLNNLDNPVPTLEVCISPRSIVSENDLIGTLRS